MAQENHNDGKNPDIFNIKIVHEKFEAAKQEDDDVNLQLYLESFEELNKFFTLMGTLFSFVSTDLNAKMDILNEFLRDSEKVENFKTVKKMIEHEKQNDLLNKKGYVSGSRTLLRLHRGLDFIQVFLQKLGELKDEENTSTACREAYDQTLANYHTFIVRNGARIAIYTLPTRAALLKRVCGNKENIKKAIELLPTTLESTADIYKRIEQLYTVHDLCSLP